jgi:hypothetical protein
VPFGTLSPLLSSPRFISPLVFKSVASKLTYRSALFAICSVAPSTLGMSLLASFGTSKLIFDIKVGEVALATLKTCRYMKKQVRIHIRTTRRAFALRQDSHPDGQKGVCIPFRLLLSSPDNPYPSCFSTALREHDLVRPVRTDSSPQSRAGILASPCLDKGACAHPLCRVMACVPS